MRLFTALWPPDDVVRDLAAALRPGEQAVVPAPARPVPEREWHVTLGFHGEVTDPARLAAGLRAALGGRRAPTVRIAGAGVFPGVLWAGVEGAGPEDEAALSALVAAVGESDPGEYRPHVTLARWPRRATPDLAALTALTSYAGRWWTPEEVLVVRSDARERPRYSAYQRIALGPPPGAP
ncbi:RNA 2',3'-cyclic phosphodiesterase [Actinoalloteichus caeruleus]|uniref:RNA 2',3'-cyclic phosphodiesterase n=1 Tax=Actinoalloteichus caeruleus DSM 43889 TaxID=1120930 RepID=A0ABT1JPI5_ACTCY|nr:RNA 2',3'-cyclic phosphodiesterase [Actinoalloteichus caeruleus]MCP2334431.1 2'-5' RNA ligase [Actinoalloteichus caeruleus DSM 43889]